MKTRKPSKKSRPSGEAQITSLCDVALSLVIFFIVTLPALLESGIFVRAPGVQQVGGAETGDEFKVAIYLRADGAYILNDEIVEKEKLGALIELLLQRSVDKMVVVRADGAVSHGDVVEILDLAKEKKAAKLALLRGKPMPMPLEEGGGE
jgi:biopolymer transport protein ExbD